MQVCIGFGYAAGAAVIAYSVLRIIASVCRTAADPDENIGTFVTSYESSQFEDSRRRRDKAQR